MSKPLPILILEHDPAQAERITHALREGGFEFVAKRAATQEEFLAELRNHQPQLILADYTLPGYDGVSALAAAQEQCPEAPFIFVSSSLGEDRVISALHHGATDCVTKDRLERLGPAVRRALREQEQAQKRKEAENERQEMQELYRALSEQTVDGILILDPVTARPLEFNTAAHRQLGYSREEFARLSLADIEAAETPAQTRANIEAVLREGKREFETRQRTREGQIRDVQVTAQVLSISGRSVYHCLWRDITERKQAEERLHLLSQALEASANAIVVTECDSTVIWANEAFTRLTGYPLAEAQGRKMSFLKSGAQDLAVYQQLWETILAGRVWSLEIINRRKDGSLYHEENTITPVRGEGGEITSFIAVKRDITERKQAEAALRQKEEYFRALTEMAADVTTVLGADGTIRYESPSAQQVFGYQPGELIGQDVLEYIHPEDLARARRALAEAVASPGSATRIELRFRHRDGCWRTVEGTTRNLLGNPNVKGIVINSRDITERRVMEAQLRQSQKMEAVGQLVGGLAHDFNNILSVIRGNADLALMDAEQCPAEVREALALMVEASERAANLTRQLLAFSRTQVLQPKALVLNEVVSNLTKLLERVIGANIELQCQSSAPLPCVHADTGMMEQVILNLVVNARDAMPQGGRLRIATEVVRLDEAQAREHIEARAGEFVCLMVSDTGTGMAPEVLLHIFEPFFTTKEVGKGTGLGLATVYGIVKQHQGWIEVASKVGEGTTFKVFLPALPALARVVGAPEISPEVVGGNETILLVEDESEVRLTLRRVLNSKGYRVWEAGSVPEALDLWQHGAGEIALLLTDILMPGNLTGWDLAERLHQENPRLKVIVISGCSADPGPRNDDFLARTGGYYLQRPSDATSILKTVRRCLDGCAAPEPGKP
jgi:PAS domain S-box-containing protein